MNPWAFGWTQLLTIVGFVVTIGIAFGGFRTFERWKREKIEERKIEVALEALALAYESKDVFRDIRRVMSSLSEWKDMPRIPGETDVEWDRRGPYYAVLKRIERRREFFDRVWKLEPKAMVVFGPSMEGIFGLVHEARAEIGVSAELLAFHERTMSEESITDARRDIWYRGGFEAEKDKVAKKLDEFRNQMEVTCRPVIDRHYGRKSRTGIVGRILDWLCV